MYREQRIHQKVHSWEQIGIISEIRGWFTICKSINEIHPIKEKKLKRQNPQVFLIRCRKNLCQYSTVLSFECPNEIRITRDIHQQNKNSFQVHT